MPTKKLAVWVYVTTEEHAQISANAERAGLSRSTYAKRVCLGQPTPSLEKQHARRVGDRPYESIRCSPNGATGCSPNGATQCSRNGAI